MERVEDYPFKHYIEYSDKGFRVQMTILLKENYPSTKIDNLIYTDYVNYINENSSKKVSKNNIIKFLNQNGIKCVNRAFYKNKK